MKHAGPSERRRSLAAMPDVMNGKRSKNPPKYRLAYSLPSTFQIAKAPPVRGASMPADVSRAVAEPTAMSLKMPARQKVIANARGSVSKTALKNAPHASPRRGASPGFRASSPRAVSPRTVSPRTAVSPRGGFRSPRVSPRGGFENLRRPPHSSKPKKTSSSEERRKERKRSAKKKRKKPSHALEVLKEEAAFPIRESRYIGSSHTFSMSAILQLLEFMCGRYEERNKLMKDEQAKGKALTEQQYEEERQLRVLVATNTAKIESLESEIAAAKKKKESEDSYKAAICLAYNREVDACMKDCVKQRKVLSALDRACLKYHTELVELPEDFIKRSLLGQASQLSSESSSDLDSYSSSSSYTSSSDGRGRKRHNTSAEPARKSPTPKNSRSPLSVAVHRALVTDNLPSLVHQFQTLDMSDASSGELAFGREESKLFTNWLKNKSSRKYRHQRIMDPPSDRMVITTAGSSPVCGEDSPGAPSPPGDVSPLILSHLIHTHHRSDAPDHATSVQVAELCADPTISVMDMAGDDDADESSVGTSTESVPSDTEDQRQSGVSRPIVPTLELDTAPPPKYFVDDQKGDVTDEEQCQIEAGMRRPSPHHLHALALFDRLLKTMPASDGVIDTVGVDATKSASVSDGTPTSEVESFDGENSLLFNDGCPDEAVATEHIPSTLVSGTSSPLESNSPLTTGHKAPFVPTLNLTGIRPSKWIRKRANSDGSVTSDARTGSSRRAATGAAMPTVSQTFLHKLDSRKQERSTAQVLDRESCTKSSALSSLRFSDTNSITLSPSLASTLTVKGIGSKPLPEASMREDFEEVVSKNDASTREMKESKGDAYQPILLSPSAVLGQAAALKRSISNEMQVITEQFFPEEQNHVSNAVASTGASSPPKMPFVIKREGEPDAVALDTTRTALSRLITVELPKVLAGERVSKQNVKELIQILKSLVSHSSSSGCNSTPRSDVTSRKSYLKFPCNHQWPQIATVLDPDASESKRADEPVQSHRRPISCGLVRGRELDPPRIMPSIKQCSKSRSVSGSRAATKVPIKMHWRLLASEGSPVVAGSGEPCEKVSPPQSEEVQKVSTPSLEGMSLVQTTHDTHLPNVTELSTYPAYPSALPPHSAAWDFAVMPRVVDGAFTPQTSRRRTFSSIEGARQPTPMSHASQRPRLSTTLLEAQLPTNAYLAPRVAHDRPTTVTIAREVPMSRSPTTLSRSATPPARSPTPLSRSLNYARPTSSSLNKSVYPKHWLMGTQQDSVALMSKSPNTYTTLGGRKIQRSVYERPTDSPFPCFSSVCAPGAVPPHTGGCLISPQGRNSGVQEGFRFSNLTSSAGGPFIRQQPRQIITPAPTNIDHTSLVTPQVTTTFIPTGPHATNSSFAQTAALLHHYSQISHETSSVQDVNRQGLVTATSPPGVTLSAAYNISPSRYVPGAATLPAHSHETEIAVTSPTACVSHSQRALPFARAPLATTTNLSALSTPENTCTARSPTEKMVGEQSGVLQRNAPDVITLEAPARVPSSGMPLQEYKEKCTMMAKKFGERSDPQHRLLRLNAISCLGDQKILRQPSCKRIPLDDFVNQLAAQRLSR